jgi:outer membrane protein OmpA-like peptidoglycan-associated protein
MQMLRFWPVTLLLLATPALAEPDKAGSKDYPAISRFPHTHIEDFDERDFDHYEFPQMSGPQKRVEGRKLHIYYVLDKGAEKPSQLEIARNYENALRSAGWTLDKTDGSQVVASLSKGGQEAWARVVADGRANVTIDIVEKREMPVIIYAGKATPRAAGAPADKKGASDYPGIPRLPGQRLEDYKESRFDQHEFHMANGPAHRVEGRTLFLQYVMEPHAPNVPSALHERLSYQKVFADEGWTVVASGDGWMTAMLRDKDKETWASIDYSNTRGGSNVNIVERGEMKQSVTASALLETLNREGHVSFEVHFDTGKDEIKAESKPMVAQMIEMLKASPALKVEVQGHTDNVGTEKDNLALSDRRAKAVMAALVEGGIEAARLTAKGYGQGKPIADNDSEGGRALNRRVELLKR